MRKGETKAAKEVKPVLGNECGLGGGVVNVGVANVGWGGVAW